MMKQVKSFCCYGGVGRSAVPDSAAGRCTEIIRAHGPDSVTFYISGQLLTEDCCVFNKQAKGVIGTNTADTGSCACMFSGVSGDKQTQDAVRCTWLLRQSSGSPWNKPTYGTFHGVCVPQLKQMAAALAA